VEAYILCSVLIPTGCFDCYARQACGHQTGCRDAFRIAASNGVELLMDQSSPIFLPNAEGVVGDNVVFPLSMSVSQLHLEHAAVP